MSLSLSSTRVLSTNYAMPLLGFGVYQNYNTKPSVLEAFKAGYRHVDSAQAYRNEAHVGEAARESGLNRSEMFITTKIISKYHGYDKTLAKVDESLEKFQFDYIDLFLIHDPFGGKDKRIETYRALVDSQKAGKIRSIGVSNYGVKHLLEIQEAGLDPPSVNQIELHPFCQQKPIVQYCEENAIVVQAYSPLIRGQMDHPVFQEIAMQHGKDPAQILIRWSLQRGWVPLPKSGTPSRIHSNADVFDFELSESDMERLDALDRGKDGAVTWNPVDAP